MPHDDVVEVRMHIAARPATIFRFFSDPDRFRRWMGVDGVFPMTPQEEYALQFPHGDSVRGSIVEIVPDQRIVFTWGYDDGKYGMAAGSTRVSIDLVATDAGTLVTLKHSGIPRPETRRDHAMGWRHYVAALSNAAATELQLGEAAVATYHAAWNETEAGRRRALLAQCWSPQAVFRDAMGYAEGVEDLSDYIGAAQKFAQGLRLDYDTPAAHAHSFVGYRWGIRTPDGSTVQRGYNVGEVSADGLLLSMTGFWDPQPPP